MACIRACSSDQVCLLQDVMEEELLQALNAVMVTFLDLRDKHGTDAVAYSTQLQVCTCSCAHMLAWALWLGFSPRAWPMTKPRPVTTSLCNHMCLRLLWQ